MPYKQHAIVPIAKFPFHVPLCKCPDAQHGTHPIRGYFLPQMAEEVGSVHELVVRFLLQEQARRKPTPCWGMLTQARIQDFLRGGGGGVNDGPVQPAPFFFFAIVKKFVEKRNWWSRAGGGHDPPPPPDLRLLTLDDRLWSVVTGRQRSRRERGRGRSERVINDLINGSPF